MKKLITFILLGLLMVSSVFCDGNWWESSEEEKPAAPRTHEMSEAPVAICNYTAGTDRYYYIVTLECKQSHFTLDLSEHLKDSINTLSFEIPVDKDYYDSVYVGQEITSSFRMGSFIMKGSIGKWKITVIDKRTILK